VTSDPDFKVTTFLKLNIGRPARLKDKVTKLLLRKRKLYRTYGMVLCLVTWIGLLTRHAGLSASASC